MLLNSFTRRSHHLLTRAEARGSLRCITVSYSTVVKQPLTISNKKNLHTTSRFQSHQTIQPSKHRYTTLQHGKMSTEHVHSAACCSIPPIVSKGYEPKGKYEEIGGMKSYVTGPSDATTAILFVFDIFGYFPQTLQGADILATSDKDNQHLIVMPDFFDGKPADISWYPPQNEEQQKSLGNFFGGIGAPPKAAGKVPSYISEVTKKYPHIKSWGGVGLCWGGKVISMTSTTDTPFKAAAECHPAMVSPDDATKITIPLCMLASADEDAEAVKGFEANLKGAKHVETFEDQIHGWMGARGDLADERVKAEYERGYKTLLEFFAKHL